MQKKKRIRESTFALNSFKFPLSIRIDTIFLSRSHSNISGLPDIRKYELIFLTWMRTAWVAFDDLCDAADRDRHIWDANRFDSLRCRQQIVRFWMFFFFLLFPFRILFLYEFSTADQNELCSVHIRFPKSMQTFPNRAKSDRCNDCIV